MKLLKIFLIIFFIFNFTQLNSVENNNELINKISKNIRCLICQGQSVYDSQSDFALSMKLVIEKKLNEGLKEKEIYLPKGKKTSLGVKETKLLDIVYILLKIIY